MMKKLGLPALAVVMIAGLGLWAAQSPKAPGQSLLPGLTAAVIARRFRSGEFDLARDLLPQDLDDILREPRFRRGLTQTAKKNTYFVLFNCRTGPAARSLTTRRALSGVVRPRDLVWRTLGRFAAPATGLIPPGMLGHDAGRRWPSLSRQDAIALLDAAGLARPIRVRAAVQPLLRDRAQALLSSLFSVWADLGVEIHYYFSTFGFDFGGSRFI